MQPNSFLLMTFILFLLSLAGFAEEDPYAVIWDTPSGDSSGSMPLGNGAYGINLWAESNGDVCFYVSNGAAWSGNAQLLKLGRVRIRLEPNPMEQGVPFKQVLDTRTGVATVAFGGPGQETQLEVWVDAHYPAVRVGMQSVTPRRMRVSAESWRHTPRELAEDERNSAYGLMDSGKPIVVGPDTYADAGSSAVLLYHRNETSIWAETLQHQDMGNWVGQGKDPLLNRTFGMHVSGQGFSREKEDTLVSPEDTRHVVQVHLHTAQTDTAEEWVRAMETVVSEDTRPYENALEEHRARWRDWHDRSWIRIEAEGTDHINRGYALQRYMTACAGRGDYPIKFNGSIFTVDAEEKGQKFDADYRRWGGPYWFQNTRLVYWPMLAAGDVEMMLPLFNMYRDMLPFAQARTQAYFKHEGAFFPETLYFWGAYANDNYGYNRADLTAGITENRYIRHYYDGILELIMLMLAYYDHTGDTVFVQEYLLPLAEPALRFYFEHYPMDDKGKLRIYPSQALETYQDAVNPMPVVAGLKSVLEGLCALPEDLTQNEQRERWQRWLVATPNLPMRNAKGDTLLASAEEILEDAKNSENPELYAIFPYRRFGIEKPDLELARRSFRERRVKGNVGWNQDETQAAFLGLTDEARQRLDDRLRRKHEGSRFPAFWGPNFDWIPDQDHGGNAMMALQTMLMQTDGDKILLLPAWPREWNVSFKLHGPHKTVIQGTYQDGEITELIVSPEMRRDQVTVMTPP